VRIAGIIADLLSEIIVITVTLRKTFHLRGKISSEDGRPSLSALLLEGGELYLMHTSCQVFLTIPLHRLRRYLFHV